MNRVLSSRFYGTGWNQWGVQRNKWLAWRIFEVASSRASDIARTKNSVYTGKQVASCHTAVRNFQMASQVRVGVGVFVFNAAGALIMGKRKGSHGAGTVLHFKTYMSISTIIQLSYMQSGTWALPGGHLDFGESFETCAMREVLEETGVQVKDNSVRFLTITNDVMPSEHKHYVTIFMACRPESEDLELKVGIVSCARAGGECNFSRAAADFQQVMEPEKCERWEWVTWQDLRRWAEVQMRRQDDDAEACKLTRSRGRHFEDRELFLPLLNLLKQRPGLDPGQSYGLTS